jgi:hypothetical protein
LFIAAAAARCLTAFVHCCGCWSLALVVQDNNSHAHTNTEHALTLMPKSFTPHADMVRKHIANKHVVMPE